MRVLRTAAVSNGIGALKRPRFRTALWQLTQSAASTEA
jgi:hypothetical protein